MKLISKLLNVYYPKKIYLKLSIHSFESFLSLARTLVHASIISFFFPSIPFKDFDSYQEMENSVSRLANGDSGRSQMQFPMGCNGGNCDSMKNFALPLPLGVLGKFFSVSG